MLKNYIITFFRNIYRNKTTSFINLFGLSLGLGGCFIIMLFVLHETGMDKFQKNRKKIYRVTSHNKTFNMKEGIVSYLFGSAIKQEFPEVEKSTRMTSVTGIFFKQNNEEIRERGIYFADEEIFEMLSFKTLEGKLEKSLKDKNNLVISESLAKKYFQGPALGKTIITTIKGEEQLFTITGVFADLSENSSIHITAIGNLEMGRLLQIKEMMSYNNPNSNPAEWKDEWFHSFYPTLIQLNNDVDSKRLIDEINNSLKKHIPKELNIEFQLQRYDKIYLHSQDIVNDPWNHGKISDVYIFSATALLILIIACANYLTLSLAQSEKRAREIGIRKASGANFRNLFSQVLTESLLITFIAFPLAIGITELMLPFLNSLLEKELVINYKQNASFVAGIVLITFAISIISGIYIAFYLNKFKPVEILRGSAVSSGVRSIFLKALVVLQIMLFIVLMISSAVILKQLKFASTFNPGMDTKNLVIIDLNDPIARRNYSTLQQELEKIPEINLVSAAQFLPPTDSKIFKSVNRFDDPTQEIAMEGINVDYNFIETMGLKLIAGSKFSPQTPGSKSGFIINESAVRELGLKDPTGETLWSLPIIGVVKDFPIHNLYSKIPPVYLRVAQGNFFTEMVIKTKISPSQVLPKIEQVWSKINKDVVFSNYTFADKVESLYIQERKLSQIIISFTIIAVLIAALGLFGLSNFITLLRTKEIGIRKVNGGSLLQMVLMLWKEIFKWVIIAFVFACPIAFYLTNRWLANFAYCTQLNWWIFAAGGLAALIITLIAVSWQTFRAANRNPVKSLRYE